MADALRSGRSEVTHVGSNPINRTRRKIQHLVKLGAVFLYTVLSIERNRR